jgi:hypothetical protein
LFVRTHAKKDSTGSVENLIARQGALHREQHNTPFQVEIELGHRTERVGEQCIVDRPQASNDRLRIGQHAMNELSSADCPRLDRSNRRRCRSELALVGGGAVVTPRDQKRVQALRRRERRIDVAQRDLPQH